MAFAKARVLIPNADLNEIELAQPTGAKITRRNQKPVYPDVLDEDGNPTGEQVRTGYEYYMEEIDELRGGWVLEAPGNPDSAFLVLTTTDKLDEIAELPDAIELERESVLDVVDAPVRMMQAVNPLTNAEIDAKRVAKNNKLRAKGMSIIGTAMKDEHAQCEHVIRQLKPDWKRGEVGIG